MSNPEPPPPSWQGGQPPDPSAPPPPGSGPPDPYTPPPPPPGYGQPADPYGPPPSSYGQPDPYAPQGPTGPMPGYGAPPPPGQPYPGQQPFPGQPYGPPPTQKSKGGKIALIVGGIVLVLLCGCVGAVVYGVNRAKDAVEEAVKTPGAPAPTGSQSPGSTGDSDSFEKGDCVVNDGSDSAPELRKVECAAGTLEVLAVIPFSTDKEQCDNEFLGAGGKHDSTYTYDETPGSLGDYVLCLKRRS